MSARVYGITPIPGGLNNQRLALLGLVGQAYLEGAKVALPEHLPDFTPLPEHLRASTPQIAFDEVFDLGHLRDGLAEHDILTEAPASEFLVARDCFGWGNAFLRQLTFADIPDGRIVSDFLRHCRAAEPLRDLSRQALELLGDRPPLALQLRIERDWQKYLARTPGLGEREESTTDARRIFAKIANAPELRDERRILACCDEDDLSQDRAELKRQAAGFGLDLVFKSEIERDLDLPASRIQRSSIDFGICLLVDRYVGLTRSSFSNMACTLRALETAPRHPEHYVYNAPGDSVLRRWDRGLNIDPTTSVERPAFPAADDASATSAATSPDLASPGERTQDGPSPGWRQEELRRRRAEIASVRRIAKASSTQDDVVARLNAKVAERDDRIAQLTQDIARIRQARDEKVERLTKRIDTLRKGYESTIGRLRADLATQTGSWSWRLTAPFRMVSNKARRLRGRP